jgi:hypothetical protein
MTGIAGFCACTEVVQVAAAPAINERTSRRLTHLQDAIALKLARFIPFTNLSINRRSQHIA